MTTIITRLYPDLATAKRVAAALATNGHDERTIDIISREGEGSADDRMRRARVPAASATAYAPGISEGRTLLVVRAPFAPMGTARNAIKVVNATPALDVGVEDEDHYVREQPRMEARCSILPGTTFFMSNPHRSVSHGHVLGQNPILKAKPRTSAIPGGRHMSSMFWPMRLLSAPKDGNSAIKGGFLFSSLFGIPTLIRDLPSREMIKTTI